MRMGAVVCRVAPSFIRFGNFEIVSSSKRYSEFTSFSRLYHSLFFPEIQQTGKEKYLAFYQEVVNRTVDMIVEWQRVGFVHG